MSDIEELPADVEHWYDEPVDAKEADAIQKRNQQPAGDYETVPEEFGEFSCTPTTNDEGRLTFTFFGRGRTQRKGEVTEASLRYRISPDARTKRNFETGEEIEGKDDLQTRLWAEAVSVYAQAQGEAPKTRRQLVEFLQQTPLRLNTMNGEDGLIVLHIKSVRRGR